MNISKGGFKFAAAEFLPQTLDGIEKMSDSTFEQIADKYRNEYRTSVSRGQRKNDEDMARFDVKTCSKKMR